MNDSLNHGFSLPPEQQAIRAKCFHPTGTFVEFTKEAVEQSIPERFEKIVCQYRNRLAVKAGYRSLTYDKLNQAANCIAWAVLEKCGPGHDPIALLFEHSIDLVPAILAALKAGKIFVALEPSLPVARIERILQDSRPTLILTNPQSNIIANQLRLSSPQILNIDALEDSACSTDPGLALSPQAIAYLLYTSGSTGHPKGVMQNHVNLLNEIRSYTNGFHITADDRTTLLTSCSSGQGLKIAFSALLNGAAIYPVDIKSEGVAHLANFLMQEQITVYHSGVGVFRYFVRTLTGQHGFSDLRLIRLASQQVLKEDVESYKQYFSSRCVLVNALSSTETGTIRWHFINKDSVVTDSTVPVGYGFEDKEVMLLDDNDREVGVNQLGEIVVRSGYLSSGYWNRPDLTESKFRPDPGGGENHLYFTGDLGLMLPDGCLIYMGRKDFRVKIRGYSVELAEVEKVLRDHPSINEAVVMAPKNDSGDARLVAYVVAEVQPFPTVSELRKFMGDKLPGYMLPSTFVFLDALPLNPNGKVNRHALPGPGNARPELSSPFAAPRNSTEKQLATVWTEVLSLDQVGIHDNFFDLGGHSLAATRVVSRVVKAFQLKLPLKALFESPTIADMALLISQNQTKQAGQEELERMLEEVEAMSDEEAQRLVSSEPKNQNL